MKNIFIISFILLNIFSHDSYGQSNEPWNTNQLIKTEDLAYRISHNEDLLIFSIGPDNIIKGSYDIGPGEEEENLRGLKKVLENVPKEKEVILYCGCCPFAQCPNIRPAFAVLKEMGFEKPRLLDIPQNIKVDWLDMNYPINDE